MVSTSLAITQAPVPCAAKAGAITAVTGNVTVNGGVVDSFQSSLGGYGGSNIGSNGNVVAKQSILVQNNAIIRGTRTPNTASSMPLLSVPAGATKLPLGASQPGSVNLNSGSLTLAPGNYVVRDLNVNAPASLLVSGGGPVTIYVTNSLNLGGNLNPNGLPSALTIVMTGTGSVAFNSSGRLNGNIYAPASTVTLNSPVFGYVVGGSVTLNTGSSLHYDALEACVNLPTTSIATKTDPAAGTVSFHIRLPSGEQIVEIFVRKNGIQVVDQDITSTEAPNNDGTSNYTYTLSGVHDGDQIDYRVSSKLPGGPNVFTPGPAQAWSSVCQAFDQCHAGAYDATLAKCVTSAKANGSACNDSNACTGTDTCQAGVCTGSQPVVCTAMDQCHAAGTCDALFGCSNPPRADGTSCNDGNACTAGDACSSGVCAGTPGSSNSDPACLGVHQGLSYDPHKRHPLPIPPLQTGCFAGTQNGWLSVPCDASNKTQNRHFEVSRAGVVVPGANRTDVSYVYGQVETNVVHTQAERDVLAPNPDLNDAWGVQLNTNSYPITATKSGLVQFVFAKFPDAAHPTDPAQSLVCVYAINIVGGTPSYDHLCLGSGNYAGTPNLAAGKLADFDYVNLAGFAFDDHSTPAKHKLATVVQYSMTTGSTPDSQAANQVPGLYAVVFDDNGLAGHWWAANGGMLGKIGGSQAVFTQGELFTTVAASNCTGDTSAAGVTCPSAPQLTSTNTSFVGDYSSQPDFSTVESDNLTFVRNPTLSFPNRNLVVTDVLASDNVPAGSTNATCLAGLSDDIFVKDNDADNGGIPSNSGGVPFWESPDIFIRPAGSAAPQINDVAADFEVTLGQSYDVYLRVNNDFGCNAVSNVQVIVDAADPNLGFTNWSPVTANADTNQFVAAPGNPTVPAFGKAIIGPFNWSPSTGLSAGHKCLKAAVVGGNQAFPFASGTTNPWPDAFKSHQIAQRNLEVTNGSTCNYAISNGSSNAANLLMGLNVTPASSLAGSVITLTFDDTASHDWFTIWSNQAAGLPAGTLSVAQGTGSTPTVIVTLNTATIALDTVSVAAGASPNVSIAISTTASPVPNVAISSRLEDPMFHTILVENGGSCQASTPLISCGEGFTLCGTACVDLSSDNANCGSCGNACGLHAGCTQGACIEIPQ